MSPPGVPGDGDDVAGVARALATARRRIEVAGADPDAVRIVAVTKGFGPRAVASALAAGLADVGENYAQELVTKAAAIDELDGHDELGRRVGPRWHFLGAVQRNKVRVLAPLVSCWQGIAREVEGAAVARHQPGARVLVEVELTGDPGRTGCPPGSVPELVAALRGMDLEVAGLMAVAPRGQGAARPAFALVRELADRLGLPERSMGMSDDLEAAVAEGSTMVRLGRALFGPRPLPGDRQPHA